MLATMLTRFMPFLLFRSGRPTPPYIIYLGKVLPASTFALLVVFCVKDTFTLTTVKDGLQMMTSADCKAQAISVIATFIVHGWRRNLMLSTATGTIAYMILIRM